MGCSPEWHTFQSNNARTGLVNRPEIHSPQIAWKTYIGIQGYLNNSIIVSNNIFVGSSGSEHNASDSLDGIYCLNKENGSIIWHFKTLSDACGVAYANNNIYTTGDDGYLRCINASTGLEKWSIKREGEVYSQPLIMNNTVIIGDESGTILMVNKNNGKIIVEKKIADSNIRGGLSSDGKYMYAAFVEGKIVCLDLKGNSVWESTPEFHGEHGEDFKSIYGAPTIAGNQLIVPFVRSTYYDMPAVYAFNKTNGKLLWKATDNGYKPLHGNIRSSVAVSNDAIFYGSPYSNTLTILGLKDGKLVNEIPMGEATDPHWSSPVITNNTLYLGRYDGGLNAIDVEKQEVIWQLFLGDHNAIEKRPKEYGNHNMRYAPRKDTIFSVFSTPSIDKNGNIYVGSGEGWLYAIKNKKTLSNKKQKVLKRLEE